MNLNHLEQLRDCCRDEAAFARLRQLLAIEPACTVERQKALSRVISKIRASLDLSTILTTTAVEIRQLLNADRVGIFRFCPTAGWSDGEFVSEDVLPEFHSALNARIQDHCFGERYAIHYQNGQLQSISDIYTAGLSDCHVDVLRRFQIRANLAVPLLQGQSLWGFLCIHQCASPRQWQPDEIEFVSQIAAHLGVALQQAELLEKVQQQSIELTRSLRELKKSQTQLIQNEKLSSLGELVAGAVQEIDHPINFIYGNLAYAHQYAGDLLELLSLYRQTYPNPEFQLADRMAVDLNFLIENFPKMLASMQLGVDRIRQIVLALCQLSPTNQAEMQSVNIHDGIDSVLLLLQHRLKPRSNATGIQVIKEYGQLPAIECYASQLNQVFMHILNNAIDALEAVLLEPEDLAEPWQQITICTGLITDAQTGITRAIIRIADNGPGMAQSVQKRLFEPFFTTKSAEKRTGLGLFISHQIVVEQHGGVLECYSQFGEGTEFWIEIPSQSSSQLPSQQTQQKTAASCTIEA